MKKRGLIFGSGVILAGLFYILAPIVFPICEPLNGKIMKCFWSARAETGLGAAVILGGLFYLLSENIYRRQGLNLMIAVLAALGGAIPTVLIGVCANEAMVCRTGTRPAWLIVSGVLLAASLINIKLLSKAAASMDNA